MIKLICVALLGSFGYAVWCCWRYLVWIRERRRYYLEHGNRRRK
jgi:hypothetical protein